MVTDRDQEEKKRKLEGFKLFPSELRKKMLYNTQVVEAYRLFNDPFNDSDPVGNYYSSQAVQGHYVAPSHNPYGTMTMTSTNTSWNGHYEPPTRIVELSLGQYVPHVKLNPGDMTLDDLIKADIEADMHAVLTGNKTDS